MRTVFSETTLYLVVVMRVILFDIYSLCGV